MKILKTLAVVLSIALLSTGMIGCQKEEGPAEKMGQSIDKSMDKTGEAVEEAGDKVEKATD